MKAAFYIDQNQIETRETDEPTLSSGDVLLQVHACGVCGTDVRKVQHGLIEGPTVLGHEVAGVVIGLGINVSKFAKGDRVVVAHHTPCYKCHYCKHENFSMCRTFKKSNLDPGGFAQTLRIPKGHVELTAHKIPETMSFSTAIFMEPLACVVRNFKRNPLLPGDTILIIGLGSMGLLTGQLYKNAGVHVIATDLKEERLALGKSLGFDLLMNGLDRNLLEQVKKRTDGRGVDLVVLTAGNAKSYTEAIQFVRDGGTLNIFAGLSPGSNLFWDANEVYSREISITSSYSPSPTELKEALEYLKTGQVNVDILKPKDFPLSELSSAIHAVAEQRVLKAIIRPMEFQS